MKVKLKGAYIFLIVFISGTLGGGRKAGAVYPMLSEVERIERPRPALFIFLPFSLFLTMVPLFCLQHNSKLSYKTTIRILFARVSEILDISDNDSRVPEVGDQREPIWAEQSAAGYSLLSVVNDLASCKFPKVHGRAFGAAYAVLSFFLRFVIPTIVRLIMRLISTATTVE